MAREVKVAIIGDASRLKREFDKAGQDADSFGDKVGSAARGAAVAVAAIGAAALAAGGALFRVGSEFNDAFRGIRVGTGATGEALEALMDDFRAVARVTPANFADISTAIADLNTRLGLTGEPLQHMAEQFLNLSRLTGTDVATNIANITRLFGDWGVEVGDQADMLDMLFRASQASGAGLDQLSRQAVQFGAPLRQMGFGVEETIALLAGFERQGVNTELVLGSMRIALGNFARAGEDAPQAFRRLVDEIRTMPDATEAAALAMEIFGSRAGPDMAAAIREGRLSIDELYAAIADGDSIAQATEDTSKFSEAWQLFKNNVLLALEPIATRVFDGMSRMMEELIPLVERVVGWFEDLADVLREEGFLGLIVELANQFRTAWDNHIYPAIQELGASIAEWFENLWDEHIRPAIETAWDAFSEWLRNDGPKRLAKSAATMVDSLVNWIVDVGIPELHNRLDEWLDAFERWIDRTSAKEMVEFGYKLSAGVALGLGMFGMFVGYWAGKLLRALWDMLWEIQQRVFKIGMQIGAKIGEGIIQGVTSIVTGMFGSNNWWRTILGPFNPAGWISGLLPGRAAGGPVESMRPYIVGERGPELFVPQTFGQIVPNHELGGGSGETRNVSYSVTINNPVGVTSEESVRHVLRRMSYLGAA